MWLLHSGDAVAASVGWTSRAAWPRAVVLKGLTDHSPPECPGLVYWGGDLLGQGPWAWAPGTALLVSLPQGLRTPPGLRPTAGDFSLIGGRCGQRLPTPVTLGPPGSRPTAGGFSLVGGGHGQGHLPPVTPDPWDRDPSLMGWVRTRAPAPVTRDPSVSQRDGRRARAPAPE